MEMLWQDVKYGFRTLTRSPGYTAVTLLMLALGIGVTTAIFSTVHGVLLRPLAYSESNRLVSVQEHISSLADKYPVLPVSARHFIEWRTRCSSFESLSLIDNSSMTLTGRGEPERLETLRVSANLFETLRMQPAFGRTFVAGEEEEGATRVAMISDGLWRRRFGADPAILGTTIMLDEQPHTVIGVLPAACRFPNVNPWKAAEMQSSAQPAVFVPKVFRSWERDTLMGGLNFAVIGRLKDGVTCDQVTAELNVIGAQIVKLAGTEDVELKAIVSPLKEALVRDSRRGLLVVLGAVGTLLLIGCLNLGILGLVRAEHRDQESAVRAALGAGRGQLLRQALVETLLIALPGTVLGVAVAFAGVDVLIRIMPADIPRLGEVRIDGRVLLFALALTGVTTLLSGVLPAWRVARTEVERVLKAGGRTATGDAIGLRLQNGFIVAEVAFGVVLLMTASLLVSSFTRVMNADRGFQAPTVLAADLTPSSKYSRWEQRQGFFDSLLVQLASAPGVRSAALVTSLPLEGETWVSSVCLPGDTTPEFQRPMANVRYISPAYFQTMGIPLLDGRVFDNGDRSKKVSVISRRLAKLLWPQEEMVIGRKFLYEDNNEEREVIGVVKDVRAAADRDAVAMLYLPYWEGPMDRAVIVASATAEPLSIAGSLRAAIGQVDPDMPIAAMRTMREVLEESVSQRRFHMLMASAFALCAIVLAGLGIYSVVSYAVTRRMRELGIRAAFGACPSDLWRMVLRQGLKPVGIGMALGLAGALLCGRLLRSLLYEVKPNDLSTLLVVAGLVLLTALAACCVPAWRAARANPMVMLRQE
ncbi:MAG: ABC transporter permease, partial [Solirubrobacterales bacterium]